MKGTQEIQDCEVQRKGTAGECCSLLDTLETSVFKDRIAGESKRKRQAEKVAMALEMAGYPERARKIRQCSQSLYRRSFSCGHESQTRQGIGWMFFRCKDKLCPNCNHVRSLKLSQRLGPALEVLAKSKGLYVYHLTLTYANTDSLPDYKTMCGQVKRLLNSDSKARKAIWDRYGYFGAVRNFEVTIGKDGRFHPHFHIILFTERPIELIETGDHAGEFQNSVNQEISDMWQKITKNSYIVKGKSFEFSQMFEMVKYITKGVPAMPATQLAELVDWSDGKRFISLLGELYANAELKQLLEEQESEDPECCPECGCNEFIDIPMRFDIRTGRYVDSEDWYGIDAETPFRSP